MDKYVEALKEEREACFRRGKMDRVAAIDAELARFEKPKKDPEIETASITPPVEMAKRGPAKKKQA